jgi:hypothetical protein
MMRSRLQCWENEIMEPISPSRGHQPVMGAERSMTPRDRRVQEQFAREHAEQTLRTRAALLDLAK